MADINDNTVGQSEVTVAGTHSNKSLWTAIAVIVLLVIVVAVLWVTGVFSSLSSGSDTSGPVAIVNGQEISRADFDEQYNAYAANLAQNGTTLDAQTEAQLKDQVIQGLVSQTLVEKYAADNNLTVTDEEVNDRYQQVLDQLSSSGQSAPSDADTAQVKDTIKTNLLVEKAMDHYAVEKNIMITEDQIQTRYDQLVAQVPEGTDVPPLTDVHDDVEAQIKQEQILSTLVDELRTDADIQILLKD
jgi:FKBP-type peptidyl-prolyl cis-trans isomerase (trigger factor)